MKKGKRRFYRNQVAKRTFFLLKVNLTRNFPLQCYLRDIVNWVVISRLSRKCQRSRQQFRRFSSPIWDKMTYSMQGVMLLIRLVYRMSKREMIGHSIYWLKRPWIRLLKIKVRSYIQKKLATKCQESTTSLHYSQVSLIETAIPHHKCGRWQIETQFLKSRLV